jgi:hypothetical protein
MLTDSLPTNATSSFAMSGHDGRAPREINAPRDEERRRMLAKIIRSRAADANTSHTAAHKETGTPQIVRKPSDWAASSRASLVQHGPTKTVFEIFTRPDLSANAPLELEDFRARLVHGDEGTVLPTDADIEMLCDEAVLMALFLVGLAWPAAVNPT